MSGDSDGQHKDVLPAREDVARNPVFWVIPALCALFARPAPSERALQASIAKHAEPFEQLTGTLTDAGFANAMRLIDADAIASQPFPLVVGLRDPTDGVGMHTGLLLSASVDSFLLAERDHPPRPVDAKSFRARYVGVAIAVAAAAPAVADPDAIEASRKDREFGFRWFVPELLKHKSIWREVLIASLVIQLLALALPLFTQAIIDKVVVHRTQSTLITLGVAMGVFTLFSAALTWVRQYLVLFTGNRVDAVLGGHVWNHLLRLPIPYFAHRPTGVIAARLHGVETIREFLASAAVTLILDLPFLLIFVGIMFWYSATLTLIVLAILSVIVILSLAGRAGVSEAPERAVPTRRPPSGVRDRIRRRCRDREVAAARAAAQRPVRGIAGCLSGVRSPHEAAG